MRERNVTIPDLILMAGTRVAFGVGLGLLISGKLSSEQRKATGIALLAVGALTTIPLAMGIIGQGTTSEQRPLAA